MKTVIEKSDFQDWYVTEVKAICPIRGELITFGGPNVPGISWKDAERFCQEEGWGFLKVIGKLVAEIPCKPGTNDPDWDKQIDYDNEKLN